jgi:flagellar biosynthesis protein
LVYRRLKVKENAPGEKRAGKPAPLTATALQYDGARDAAPRVVASGKRKMAEQILALARQNHIPIHDDPVLAAALSSVHVGEEIPPALYQVVAEVLAYIYRVAGRSPDRDSP